VSEEADDEDEREDDDKDAADAESSSTAGYPTNPPWWSEPIICRGTEPVRSNSTSHDYNGKLKEIDGSFN